MIRTTAADALLAQLSQEHRRLFSSWRALVLLNRAATALPARLRRWRSSPVLEGEIHPILLQLKKRGLIRSIGKVGHRTLYQVVSVDAAVPPIDIGEAIMEVNPYCALTHMAALAYHDVTDHPVHSITAVILAPRVTFDGDPASNPRAYLDALLDDRRIAVLPPDTRASDWVDLPQPPLMTPARILTWPVDWDRSGRFFDIQDDRRRGYTVRVTSLEQTLIDGLQKPQLCGGIETVLAA